MIFFAWSHLSESGQGGPEMMAAHQIRENLDGMVHSFAASSRPFDRIMLSSSFVRRSGTFPLLASSSTFSCLRDPGFFLTPYFCYLQRLLRRFARRRMSRLLPPPHKRYAADLPMRFGLDFLRISIDFLLQTLQHTVFSMFDGICISSRTKIIFFPVVLCTFEMRL